MMIDLGSATTIRGVVTQGRGDANQYVTAFTVQVSTDGATFADVDGGATFTGNTNYLLKVTNTFAATVQARFVKIFPKTWYGRIGMRAGVLDANLPTHATVGRSREAAVVTVGAAAGTSISMFSFDGMRACFRCSVFCVFRACMATVSPQLVPSFWVACSVAAGCKPAAVQHR